MNILLVPADIFWAEGKIALNIFKQSLKNPSHRFLIFPVHHIKHRKQEFETLLKKVDAVHWLMNSSNISFLKDKNLKEVSVYSFATVHHVEPDEFFKIEKAKEADLIHVISEEWFNYCKYLGLENIFLAPLGVDMKFFRKKAKKRIENSILKIGHFGNLIDPMGRKRFDVLLEAVSMFKDKEWNVELILSGKISDMTLDLLQRAGIKYENLGYLTNNELVDAYNCLDVYVITSDCEGGPFGLLEALSCGIPVISTDVGLSCNLIKDDYNGFLIPKNNPQKLYTALNTVFLKAEEQIDNMKINARKSVEEYDWKYIYNQYYLKLYCNASSRKNINLFLVLKVNFLTFFLSYFLKYYRAVRRKLSEG